MIRISKLGTSIGRDHDVFRNHMKHVPMSGEIIWDGSNFQHMNMPEIRNSATVLNFDAYIPDDDIDSEAAFSFYGPSNVPRILLKFKPSENIMQIQGKTNNNVTIDEDTATYTHFGEYASISLNFAGPSLRLFVNSVLFHTFTYPAEDGITPSLFLFNACGANDQIGNQPLRDGCKMKNISGICSADAFFSDDLRRNPCSDTESIAAIIDLTNGQLFWTQETSSKRPIYGVL